MKQIKNHSGLQIGDILCVKDQKILISEKIGSGGMAELFRGEFQSTGQSVAIKEFKNAQTYDVEKYWAREAHMINLQSQSLVPCMRYYAKLKLVINNSPEYYLFFEYLKGMPLYRWYRTRYCDVSEFEHEDYLLLLNICLNICQHLGFIHENFHIVHRDLTIENIMMVYDETTKIDYPVIIDWGIARQVAKNRIFKPPKPFFSQENLEATGIFNRGCPPELIGGYEPVAATDIYMFGHLMFYLFSGGELACIPSEHQDYVLHPIDFNPDMPEEINTLVEKMTQYEPANRITNLIEVWDNLNSIILQLSKLNEEKKIEPNSITDPKKIQKLHQFKSHVHEIGQKIFQLLKKYENLRVSMKIPVNIPLPPEMINYQKEILLISNDFEKKSKILHDSNLSDEYFLIMQIKEFELLESRISQVNDQFRSIQQICVNFIQSQRKNSPISQQSKSISEDEIQYSKLLTRLIRENLNFKCENCLQPLPFGEIQCEQCNWIVQWPYNPTKIIPKLLERSNHDNLVCPGDHCGAIIRLDWETCAYCGLDLKNVLASIPFIENI